MNCFLRFISKTDYSWKPSPSFELRVPFPFIQEIPLCKTMHPSAWIHLHGFTPNSVIPFYQLLQGLDDMPFGGEHNSPVLSCDIVRLGELVKPCDYIVLSINKLSIICIDINVWHNNCFKNKAGIR